MALGLAIAAERARPVDHRMEWSIGAELVGSDAIQTNDIAAYWELAEKWLRDPAAARAAGVRQQARAMAELDYGVICDKYERIALSLAKRRARSAVQTASLATAG